MDDGNLWSTDNFRGKSVKFSKLSDNFFYSIFFAFFFLLLLLLYSTSFLISLSFLGSWYGQMVFAHLIHFWGDLIWFEVTLKLGMWYGKFIFRCQLSDCVCLCVYRNVIHQFWNKLIAINQNTVVVLYIPEHVCNLSTKIWSILSTKFDRLGVSVI